MMDAKYLDEIKARCEAATPGAWVSIFDLKGFTIYDMNGEKGKIIAKLRNTKHGNQRSDASFIAAARTDIPALLTEVERLKNVVKIQRASCNLVEMAKAATIVDGIVAKDQQIATLKKALELICEDCSDACPAEWGAEHALCETCNSDDPKQRAKCQYDYYIQQAQEQEGHDGD